MIKRFKLTPKDVVNASLYDLKMNLICSIKKTGFSSLRQVQNELVKKSHSIGQWRYFECSANNGRKQFRPQTIMINILTT
jgi:hypothetical protein